jgi:hypothetical protein
MNAFGLALHKVCHRLGDFGKTNSFLSPFSAPFFWFSHQTQHPRILKATDHFTKRHNHFRKPNRLHPARAQSQAPQQNRPPKPQQRRSHIALPRQSLCFSGGSSQSFARNSLVLAQPLCNPNANAENRCKTQSAPD